MKNNQHNSQQKISTKKTAFITGASQGIGRALAIQLAKNNWNLFLTARNENALSELKEEIENNFDVRCNFGILDVKNQKDYEEKLNKCLSLFGTIDFVILNAGISQQVWFDNFDFQKTEEIFQTNFFGVLKGLNTFIDYFKKKNYTISENEFPKNIKPNKLKGKIAIVSSLADARGFLGSSVYCASKSAVSFIAESARIELEKEGIEIITIKPGFIRTNMTANNEYYMPFLISSEKFASDVYKGLSNGKRIITSPKPTAFFSYLIKMFPSVFYEFLIKKWRIKKS